MSEGQGFCRKCGTEIEEGDVFCSKCGAKLDSPGKVVTPEAKSNNTAPGYTVPDVKPNKSSFTKKLLYGIVGIIGIFFILVIIGAMLPHSNDGNYRVLNIKTNPPSALVKVDGVYRGLTPINNLPVKIGVHDIDVESKGYPPCHETRDISNSTQETLYYDLKEGEEARDAIYQDRSVCYWDWKYETTSRIGYESAPAGESYVVVTLYIKNNVDKSISTNPFFWSFTADGIKYTADAATFSKDIKHQSVDVGKGGEIETQFVYLVKGKPSEAYFAYTGLNAPEMQKLHLTFRDIFPENQ